jgi:hypothetical protein
MNPAGGHAHETGFRFTHQDGVADLETPFPQTRPDQQQSKFNALAVHDIRDVLCFFVRQELYEDLVFRVGARFREAFPVERNIFALDKFFQDIALLINRRKRYRAHTHRKKPDNWTMMPHHAPAECVRLRGSGLTG